MDDYSDYIKKQVSAEEDDGDYTEYIKSQVKGKPKAEKPKPTFRQPTAEDLKPSVFSDFIKGFGSDIAKAPNDILSGAVGAGVGVADLVAGAVKQAHPSTARFIEENIQKPLGGIKAGAEILSEDYGMKKHIGKTLVKGAGAMALDVPLKYAWAGGAFPAVMAFEAAVREGDRKSAEAYAQSILNDTGTVLPDDKRTATETVWDMIKAGGKAGLTGAAMKYSGKVTGPLLKSLPTKAKQIAEPLVSAAAMTGITKASGGTWDDAVAMGLTDLGLKAKGMRGAEVAAAKRNAELLALQKQAKAEFGEQQAVKLEPPKSEVIRDANKIKSNYGAEKFNALKEDIKKNGISEPLEVLEDATGNRVVYDGTRRYIAAKELGITEIPQKIIKVDDVGRYVPEGAQIKISEPPPKDTQAAEIVPPRGAGEGISGKSEPTRPSTAKDKGLSLEELERAYEARTDKNGNPLEMATPEGERGIAAVDYSKGERAFIFDPQTKKWYDKTSGSRKEVTDQAQIDKLNDAKPGRGYVAQPELEISGTPTMSTEERAALGIKEVPTATGQPKNRPRGETVKPADMAAPKAAATVTDNVPPEVPPAPIGAPEPPKSKISQVVNVAPTKAKPNTIGTFTKEFGKETALELSKDFAGYQVRDPERAARELLADGIQLTREKLIGKKGEWDEYDLLKANEIRKRAALAAKSPDDLVNDTQLIQIMRRSKESLSTHGKGLQTAAEVDPITDPIRAAEQKVNEQIEETTHLRKAKQNAKATVRKVKENMTGINKKAATERAGDIARQVKRALPFATSPKEKIAEDGYKQGVFDFLKRELTTRYKLVGSPKTAQELLANRVAGRVEPPDPNRGPSVQDTMVRDVVNTVYQSISDKLPAIPDGIKTDAVYSSLRNRIVNSTEYSAALQNAKTILRQKYAGNKDAMAALDKVLAYDLLRPATDKIVESLIKQEIKSSGNRLSDIIKQHYTEIDKTGKGLAQKIVEKMGLSETDAAQVEKYVADSFHVLTAGAKQKVLNGMLGGSKKKPIETDVLKKIVELSNLGAMDEAQFADVVARRMGVPVITPDHMFKISKQAQKIQEMPQDTPQQNIAVIDEIGRLYSMLYTDAPKTKLQKAMDIRVLSMLANFKSAERNVAGQGADTAVTSISKTVLGVPMDKLITKMLTKRLGYQTERTMTATDLKFLVKNIGKAWVRGNRDVKNDIDTLKPTIEREFGVRLGKDADKFGIGRPEWKKGSVPDMARKGVAYLLQAPDRGFQEGVFRESYQNQLNALRPETRNNLTQELKQKIVSQAWREASTVTYRKMNAFSNMIVGLQKKMGTVGQLILTFPKVASNIMYSGAYQYGPVGLGVATNRIRKFVKSGGVEVEPTRPGDKAINQRELALDFARGGAGTALMAVGVLAGYTAAVTGGKEEDSNVQKTKEAIGQQAGAIKIGNHYYRWDWMQPMAIPLELGVEIGKAIRNKKDTGLLESTLNILGGAATSIADQPLLSTLKRMTSVPGETFGKKIMAGAEALISSSFASLVPTLMGQGRQLVDRYQRNVFGKYGEGETNKLKAWGFNSGAMILNKIPFASRLLEKRRDIFGRPMEYHQSGNLLFDALDRFANPSIITDAKRDPGVEFILKLNEDRPKGMREKPLPKLTEKTWYIEQDKKRYYMTPSQRGKYQELVGKEAYDFIKEYYESNKNSSIATEDMIKEIYDELGDIGKRYRAEMLEELGAE